MQKQMLENFCKIHNNIINTQLFILITSKCNLKCPWCIANAVGNDNQPNVNIDNMLNNISYLLTHPKLKINKIFVSGGEPLLEFNKLIIIIKHIKSINDKIDINILTNGTLITQPMVELLNSYNISVIVSLNGSGYKSIDMFKKINPNGIELINNLNNISIRTVIDYKSNYYNDIYNIYKTFPNTPIEIAYDFTKLNKWCISDIKHNENQLNNLLKKQPLFFDEIYNNLFNKKGKRNYIFSFHNNTDKYLILRMGSNGNFKPKYEKTLEGFPIENNGYTLISEFDYYSNLFKKNVKEEWFKLMNKIVNYPVINMCNNVKKSVQFQILTNLDCNLRCKYCYENKCNKVNNIESMKLYIHKCYEYYFDKNIIDNNTKIVWEFIGGESFLYPEMLDVLANEILLTHSNYNMNKPFNLRISTNGTLIYKDIKIQNFIKKWEKYLFLSFSIDGDKNTHNKCRIYNNGIGSYDDIIKSLDWIKLNMSNSSLYFNMNIKATYCHDTIKNYADGVINLIKLGFNEVRAEVVYEEIWTDDDYEILSNQFIKIADYIIDNDLENKVFFRSLNPKGMNMLNYEPKQKPKNPYCGGGVSMLCLGFDNKLYGCNRFAINKNDLSIGKIEDNKIIFYNDFLIKDVLNMYNHYPEKCKKCGIGNDCPLCTAIYYNDLNDNILKKYPMCGWTKAMVVGKLYFKDKLIKKLNKMDFLSKNDFLKTYYFNIDNYNK